MKLVIRIVLGWSNPEVITTTALATDPHAQSDPVWSPDSRYVAFNLLPNGGSDPPFLVEKIEIGSQQPQKVYGDNERHWVEDWSRDGRFVLQTWEHKRPTTVH